MARVCRVTRDITEQYQKAAFNINAFLSPFFDSVAFRSLQGRTQTLIGGSFAFSFLERSYPRHSIDLMVYPAHSEEVGRWLLDNGYHFVPLKDGESFDSTIAHAVSDTRDNADSLVIRDVLCFRKPLSNTTSVGVSVLIAVNNPLEIVFSACASKNNSVETRFGFRTSNSFSFSACFFSAISWRRAYCIFPRATLHNNRVLLLDTLDGPLDLSQAPNVAGYIERRNLEVQDTLDEHEYLFSNTHSPFPLGARTMTDNSSLSIDLDIADIPLQSTDAASFPTDDVVNSCGFRLRGDFGGRSWVDYTLVLAPLLKYSWLMSRNELLHQLTRELDARLLEASPTWSVLHSSDVN